MAEILYPTFDAPEMIESETEELPIERIAPKFNPDQAKFEISGSGQVVMGDEIDAYRFWVTKCLLTERFRYPAYSTDFGIEIESIIRADYPREVAESEIQRTITEALKVDPRTSEVDEFSFNWDGDSAQVSFIIESIYGQDDVVVEIGGESIVRVRYS